VGSDVNASAQAGQKQTGALPFDGEPWQNSEQPNASVATSGTS